MYFPGLFGCVMYPSTATSPIHTDGHEEEGDRGMQCNSGTSVCVVCILTRVVLMSELKVPLILPKMWDLLLRLCVPVHQSFITPVGAVSHLPFFPRVA